MRLNQRAMKALGVALFSVFVSCAGFAAANVDQTPEGQTWSEIWKKPEHFKSLKKFHQRYGTFLETPQSTGKLSFSLEGPCTAFFSLVRNSRNVAHPVWEIKKTGQILRSWKAGSDQILGFDRDSLFVKTFVPEKLSNLDSAKTPSAMHVVIVQVTDKGLYELKPDDFSPAHPWKNSVVTCPENLMAKTTAPICLQDDATHRIFVIEETCS